MGKYAIATLNVRGMRNKKKRCTIKRYLDHQDISICVLQETHSTVGDEQEWTKEWNGEWIFDHGTKTARGIAIWSRMEKMTKTHVEGDGRLIMAQIPIEGICAIVSLPSPSTWVLVIFSVRDQIAIPLAVFVP